MFQVEVDGVEWKVYFEHSRDVAEYAKGQFKGGTLCYVYSEGGPNESEPGAQFFNAMSTCRVRESCFDKNKGRKVAMGRLLRQWFPRDKRHAFWAKYREVRGRW